MRDLFDLDPAVAHLDVGDAPPKARPVLERWRSELARPSRTGMRRLADFLGTSEDRLVPTAGTVDALAHVARRLGGGEVVATTEEHPLVEAAWRAAGYRWVARPAHRLLEGATGGVVLLSHVTCLTCRVLPVAEVVQEARLRGLVSVIDGAHGPGNVDVRLDDLDADFYAGSLHKWLGAPAPSGFLWAREPAPGPAVSPATAAAVMAAETALECLFGPGWLAEAARCRRLAGGSCRMASRPLPLGTGVHRLRQRLRGVRVLVDRWGGRPLLRACFHVYNAEADAERLESALREALAGEPLPMRLARAARSWSAGLLE